MRTAELKKLAKENHIDTSDCFERQDIIRLLEQAQIDPKKKTNTQQNQQQNYNKTSSSSSKTSQQQQQQQNQKRHKYDSGQPGYDAFQEQREREYEEAKRKQDQYWGNSFYNQQHQETGGQTDDYEQYKGTGEEFRQQSTGEGKTGKSNKEREQQFRDTRDKWGNPYEFKSESEARWDRRKEAENHYTWAYREDRYHEFGEQNTPFSEDHKPENMHQKVRFEGEKIERKMGHLRREGYSDDHWDYNERIRGGPGVIERVFDYLEDRKERLAKKEAEEWRHYRGRGDDE